MLSYLLAASLVANVYCLFFIRKQNYAFRHLYAAFIRAAFEAGWVRLVKKEEN